MSLKRRALTIASKTKSNILKIRVIRRFPQGRSIGFIRERGIEVLYLITLFALTAGIVNTLLEGFRVAQAQIPIIPFRSAQTSSEVALNFILLATGTSGVYLTYLSGRQAVRQRATYLYLIMGLTTVFLSLLLGIYILAVKGF